MSSMCSIFRFHNKMLQTPGLIEYAGDNRSRDDLKSERSCHRAIPSQTSSVKNIIACLVDKVQIKLLLTSLNTYVTMVTMVTNY